MATITEIAPDVYRICIYVPEINLGFSHFLIKDEEPLLFHTGFRQFFPQMREAVASLIEPSKLRYISFSHFESDECGALNEWLNIAPNAETLSGMVGALVNLNDFAQRPARILNEADVVTTGKYRFRFISTPQVPHGWDAGVLFEETQRTLFCSDLLHHDGDVEPLTHSAILDRVRETLARYQAGPLASYMPYSQHTDRVLRKLAGLKPTTLALMHGSSYSGDGEKALRALSEVMRDVLGEGSDK